jgi:membrane protease YdiL (CAAX protease family)
MPQRNEPFSSPTASQPSAFITAIKLVWFTFRNLLTERPGQIMFSAILLLVLWGFHGNMELLTKAWPVYEGPGSDPVERTAIFPDIPWDHEVISFWGGFFLVVVVPAIIIKWGFKEKLADYGLGTPKKGQGSLAVVTFVLLMVISVPAFFVAAKDEGMRSVYPFYRGTFSSTGQFILYELCYLPFFIAIEFIFRGYLLFGLARSASDKPGNREDGFPARYIFSRHALLIAALPYIAWHLGKPLPELFGTLFWGVAAGALALRVGSLWPVIVAHWLLNVLLDGMIAGIF